MRDLWISKSIYGEEEIQAVVNVLRSGWLGIGKKSEELERKMCEFIGTKYGMFINSGSSALLLGLKVLNLPKGTEVITCAAGFPSTMNPILHLGLTPVVVDAELDTFNIDPKEVTKAITKKTGAIVFAHAAGNMCNMKELIPILDKYPSVEDACLVAGTKVKTFSGDKNIEDVKEGDLVLTRNGYKKVLKSGITGYKNVITKLGLTGTPNHPVITCKGVIRLDTLGVSDIIYIWNEKLSSIEVKSIIDTQPLLKDKEDYIFGDILKSFHFHSIDKFGLIIMEKFLKDFTFIIKTVINSIIIYPTLNLLLHYYTLDYTSKKQEDWKQQIKILNLLERKLLFGTKVKKEGNGIKYTEKNVGLIKKLLLKFVRFVEKNIKHSFQLGQKTVQNNVKKKVAVYNLKIDSSHEFFANNILVHNCDTLGGEYKGKKAGSFGTVGAFSLFASHHITAAGGGGMAVTNDEKIMTDMFSMRDWGKRYVKPGYYQRNFSKYDTDIAGIPYDVSYSYDTVGYNMKLIEVGAAFAVEQMKRLPGFIKRRNENFENLYELVFDKYKLGKYLILPRWYEGHVPAWFFFVVTLRDGLKVTRKQLGDYLESKGVRTRPFFAGNITEQPALKDSDFKKVGALKNSDKLMKDTIMVGIHPGLTDNDIEYTADTFRSFFKQYA
jgi:dTDP-4-amino-4,6-dideoxygalactose transaminase